MNDNDIKHFKETYEKYGAEQAIKILNHEGYGKYREIAKTLREIRSSCEQKKKQPSFWTKDKIDILQDCINKYGINNGVEEAKKILCVSRDICRRAVKYYNIKYHVQLLDGEEFKRINCKGEYYISNKGRIKVCHSFGDKILSPFKLRDGYLCIKLISNEDDKLHSYRVHRLVADVFIPNPENKTCVDHINTNRLDNCVENLRWVTPEENMNNELTMMHLSISKGLSSKAFKINVIDRYTNEEKEFNSMSQLYRYFGLEYIHKYVGIQYFRDRFVIVMSGEDNDDYYIGKMLRRGNTKEELIDKVKNYSELREYHNYLKELDNER